MAYNLRQHRILTPEYYKGYLETKKRCRLFYEHVNAGYYKNNILNFFYQIEIDNYSDMLIDWTIPETDEINIKAGRKRKGKPLPLKFER